MPPSKILFTDLDGTLLNDAKQITDINRQAVHKALEQGHKIVVSTGRPLFGALPTIQKLDLEQKGCYAITCNGSQVYDCYQKKMIFQQTLPLSYVKHIFEETEKRGLYCHTYSSTHVLAKAETPELADYIHHTSVPYRIVPDLLDKLTEEPVKMVAIHLSDRQQLNDYREAMEDWSQNKVSLFLSSPNYLEHVPAGVSKGKAALWLYQRLEIPRERTIAIGDAENDISMLKQAHIGAAMANAAPEVKKLADYITENDNNHNGVAETIHKFLL